ncbi:MAG: FkbM family methyltransferase [Bacteroidota bacterium]
MKLASFAGTVSRAFAQIPGGFYVAKLLKNLFHSGLKHQAGFTTYRSAGMTFRVELSTNLGAKMFWRGAHSWPPIFVLQHYVNPGFTCVDLGANQGEYTLWMSKLAGPAGEVHSFEPSSKMLEQLRATLALNSAQAQTVTVHPFGLSDANATVELFLPQAGSAAHNEGAATVFRTSSADESLGSIELRNAGEALQSATARKLDFIKIDIEGSELRALRGMRERLERDRPLILIEINRTALELAETSPRELATFLTDLGYRLNLIGTRGRLMPYSAERANEFDDVNVLAI